METLSPAEIDQQGLSISYTMPKGAANPEFAGPGRGGGWTPDFSKYAPELAHQVRQAVETQP